MRTQRLILIAGLLMLALGSQAQDSLLLRDYQFVKRQNVWLTTRNAAALTRYAHDNIAEAEVLLNRQRGGLTNFDGSSSTWQTDISIESFYRISPQTVFYGGISYENFSGKDMAGSAFIPFQNHRPFDIVEDSLNNTGTKHSDTYHLTGGIGSTVYKDIAIGAQLDYTAANYAKYKDLRHQNKMMDLLASASIYSPITQWASIGAHYQYHRNIENVVFAIYGDNDKVYKSLIDYGAFFGRIEQFGTEGFTDKSREMPLFDEGHGGGLQLELRPTGGLSVFGSLTKSHRDGYYGRKSPYTLTYTQHSGDKTELQGRLILNAGTSTHRLDLAYTTEELKNLAEVFREQQNASGATYYEYSDPVETTYKKWEEGSITYTGDWLINGELPTWTIQAGINWMKRIQTAYLYPYFRYQELKNHEYFLNLTHHLMQKKGVWSFTLQGSYLKGSGLPSIDGNLTTPNPYDKPAPTMEAYLMREYLYLTAAQYAIGGQVKYAFVFPNTRLKTHIRLELNHRKTKETIEYSNGYDRTCATVAIGCTF